MENDKGGEKPKMSENKEEKDVVNRAVDIESESKSIVTSEANAIRRVIKSLNWRHKLQGQDILRQISAVRRGETSNTELMTEVTAYQARFQRLDESYSHLYQILEGDSDAGEDHLIAWDRLVKEERAMKSLLEDKLGNHSHE